MKYNIYNTNTIKRYITTIITNNDNIWLKPAWSKLIELKPKFLNFNFVTLPEKKIYNKNPIFYYLSNFGLKNVILLSN